MLATFARLTNGKEKKQVVPCSVQSLKKTCLCPIFEKDLSLSTHLKVLLLKAPARSNCSVSSSILQNVDCFADCQFLG
jgi:hypothetical protein